jgi:flagellar M-ring protein FliF
VKVDVTADIDQSQVTVQEEKYDPDGQVVVSEQTTGENEKQNQPDAGATGVSVGANLPGATPGSTSSNTSATDRQASTTNYANSKSVRTEVQAPGAIKKISVAVAVDGVTGPTSKDGKPGPYKARTAEEMANIDALVKAAVGFDQTRGDVVQVKNVPFPHDSDLEGVTAAGPLSGFDKNDIMRAVELGVLGIVAVLIMLFAVRPLLRGVLGGGGNVGGMPLLGGQLPGSMTRTVSGPGGQPLQVTVDGVTGENLALPPPEIDSRIDIARIEGQVKASSIKRVSEFVDRHPEESVSILRSWLHETA